MATRGTATGLTKSAAHTKTSPEEPWSAAGEVYRSRVWQDLRSLFQQDELTDVMLAAEGQSIPCHKVLLAAASKFFHGKFVVKPETLEHNLLDIDDIDFDTLASVVSFIYSGRVELTVEKAEKLIPGSVNLMLPELTNMCKDFLFDRVDNDTSACIAIHRISKANSLTDISDKVWWKMLDNFQKVTATNDFKGMTEMELKEYISDKRLNVANEDPVFEALVTWVTHDEENRKSRFDSLMENVKLSHCSPSFLRDTVRPLMKSTRCLELLSDALLCYTPSFPHQAGTARRDYGGGNTLVAVYEDHCWTLKDGETEWVVKPGSSVGTMSKYREDRRACIAGNRILVTGGYSDPYSTDQCLQISLPTLKWSALPNLSMARCDHATVCVGNQVYVLGGWTMEEQSSVEYLDEETGSWHVTCDMPSALWLHTAVSYKYYIYVFGGSGSQTTFMLDTVTKKWSWKADMPKYCSCAASVVYRDRIYVLSGDEKCCMSYDPDQDQWKTHSKPAVKHVRPSAVVWKDRILLCGGSDTSVIEEYNPDTDTWSEWKHQLPKTTENPPAVFRIQM